MSGRTIMDDSYFRCNSIVRYKLLVLLVKLELYPSIMYEGKPYPCSRGYSKEYREWFYGSTFD